MLSDSQLLQRLNSWVHTPAEPATFQLQTQNTKIHQIYKYKEVVLARNNRLTRAKNVTFCIVFTALPPVAAPVQCRGEHSTASSSPPHTQQSSVDLLLPPSPVPAPQTCTALAAAAQVGIEKPDTPAHTQPSNVSATQHVGNSTMAKHPAY